MEITVDTVTGDEDRAACLAIRHSVFIIEQAVPPEIEIDGLDDDCTHLLARWERTPAGTLRIRWLPEEAKARIQRVAVLPDFRGRGIAGSLMDRALAAIQARSDIATVSLGAQAHAIAFYQKRGFAPVGEPYMDAGIPHLDMERPLR